MFNLEPIGSRFVTFHFCCSNGHRKIYALTILSVALVRESDLKKNTKCNINSIKKWPDESKGEKKTSAYVDLSPKIKSLCKNVSNNFKTKYNRFTENIYSENKSTKVRLRNSLVKVYISEEL